MDGEAQTTDWTVGPQAPEPAPGDPDWRRHALGLVIALVIGLGVRIWWLSTVDTQPVTDFDWYFERARGLVNGLGYSVGGKQTAYWPVGYPGTLAVAFRLFGVSVLVGKVFNTVLTLAAIGLAWRVAFRLFRDHRVATGAALVLAVHPAYLAYSGILASEPLYTCLILLGILDCLAPAVKGRNWTLLAGAAFGFATLVRPQAVLIPLIVVVCARLWDAKDGFKGRALKTALKVYVVLIVSLLPWMVRNQVALGAPVFVSTNGGDNLLIGNSPGADGRYENPNELGYDLSTYGEVDRDRKATKLALAYAKGHWRKTVALWPVKLNGTFLSGTDAPYWAFQKEKGHMVSPGLGSDKAEFKSFRNYSVSFTGWLLLSAGLGVLLTLLNFKRSRMPITGLVLIGYSALLSIVFFGNPRFAYPIVPFLAMHACQGLLVVWDVSRRTLSRNKDGQQPLATDRPTPPAQAPIAESQNS